MRSKHVWLSRAFALSAVSVVGIAACGGLGTSAPPSRSVVDPTSPAPEFATQCTSPDYQVDNMEDGNNQVNTAKGRAGYWYTYQDEKGTKVSPPPGSEGGQFAMRKGGNSKSQFSACMKGRTAASGDTLFAGMGFNFADPKGPYDASAYKGISFWARIKGSSTGAVRVKFPDVNTDPDGKKCSGCFNDFGYELNLTDEWTRYVLPWESLKQEKGWGSPRPSHIDPSQIFAMQWQVKGAGQVFDVCVDDIEFIGCNSADAAGASKKAKKEDDDD